MPFNLEPNFYVTLNTWYETHLLLTVVQESGHQISQQRKELGL